MLSGRAKPEIKSPAGHWPQLRAAIEAGADAVYFGLTHFTARAKSGFTLAELPEAMRTLRSRGVKGYITFNTLIFDSELRDAAHGLAAIAEAGADAIIVQDWAAVALAREIAPHLAIHGSTQMSVTDADGARRARDLGVGRLILARELSLREVRAVREATWNDDIELEIFVHGALCVSYSGQCFSSEAWGGRSANRGQCAQACRLPYEMVVDGETKPLGDARYLLSPGDLYAVEQIPEIVEIGLSALKIEGRYKDAEYVSITTRAYREAVDRACLAVAAPDQPVADRAARLALEQAYSRGLGPWFLTGTDHQAVVKGRAPRHRGLRMGVVRRIVAGRPGGHAIVVDPDSGDAGARPLKPGDGVVFDAADWRSPQEPEEGGRLYEVDQLPDGDVELSFANGAIRANRIRPGDVLWRTDDPALSKSLRGRLDGESPLFRQPVRVRVVAVEGEPLQITWTLVRDADVSVETASEIPLQRASERGIDEELLRQQLGRLGNTAYELDSVELHSNGQPFAPASLLNRMRRDAVEALAKLQTERRGVDVGDPDWALERVGGSNGQGVKAGPAIDRARMHLLVRTPEQLDAALAVRPDSITLDYLDLYGLKPSIERVKQAGLEARVASPRILKPGEERIAGFLLRCDCPILVRGAGLLESLRRQVSTTSTGGEGPRLDGDFSLNAANAVTARMLFELGIDRLAPAHDLNGQQVASLALGLAGPGTQFPLEAIAYHHLPVFHTEHCVFCRFLSTGTSYKDCGRPCEKHRIALRDTGGRAHAVMADVGCRNTVFGAEAQEASAYLDDWQKAGIRDFRLEFVHETGAQVAEVSKAFGGYWAGRISGRELHRRLTQTVPQGTTQGSLHVPSSGADLFPVLR